MFCCCAAAFVVSSVAAYCLPGGNTGAYEAA